jgi:hypothetical protein
MGPGFTSSVFLFPFSMPEKPSVLETVGQMQAVFRQCSGPGPAGCMATTAENSVRGSATALSQ